MAASRQGVVPVDDMLHRMDDAVVGERIGRLLLAGVLVADDMDGWFDDE